MSVGTGTVHPYVPGMLGIVSIGTTKTIIETVAGSVQEITCVFRFIDS